GGVVAGGDGRRVAGSELVDWRDPEMELVFGVGRKILPEKIFGGSVVVAGGGGRWRPAAAWWLAGAVEKLI
ncbi:hypothetical protein Tco_0483260, partial [Tanacetum coccineum]